MNNSQGDDRLTIRFLALLETELEMDGTVENAYIVSFYIEDVTVTLRIVLGDGCGADIVITNMTTFPNENTCKGYGSQAVKIVLSAAQKCGMPDIRAVQVQKENESFWEKNGFRKIDAPNPCNDFIHRVNV